MGRARPSIPRSQVPLHRRAFLDPAALRYWLAVTALAVVLAAVVGRATADARALRDRWGPTRDVVVTTEAVSAGSPLAPATDVARWPVALVPDDAVDPPADGRAAAALDPGTPITEALVRSTDAARASERHVALDATHPRLAVGDHLDVWATTDPTLDPTAGDAEGPVATDARVVAVDEASIVVAVDIDQVAAVTRARSVADLVVAVVP